MKISAFIVVALAAVVVSEPVLARGAAATIMSSPGYQRRLQESRGAVTTYSNGDVQPAPPRKQRYRHRR